MFRALAALFFIVVILPLAALVASLIMKALGVTGVLGFVVGFPVFVVLLTASVMLLASINDRLNNPENKERYRPARHRTHTNSAH